MDKLYRYGFENGVVYKEVFDCDYGDNRSVILYYVPVYQNGKFHMSRRELYKRILLTNEKYKSSSTFKQSFSKYYYSRTEDDDVAFHYFEEMLKNRIKAKEKTIEKETKSLEECKKDLASLSVQEKDNTYVKVKKYIDENETGAEIVYFGTQGVLLRSVKGEEIYKNYKEF